MKFGILGTGTVGQTIGTKLCELGHEVRMGSRSEHGEKTLAWMAKAGPNASEGTFAEAAAFGEILFNCTSGMHSLEAVRAAGVGNIGAKILIDVSNPLDFSKGFPPSLSVCNTDSLAEQIQREVPAAKVVKALNTVNASLMVNPSALPGQHDLFICGNDAEAKAKVHEILTAWFGWQVLIDLGDITSARATEQILPVWVRLMTVFKTPMFNFHIIK